MYVWGGVTIAIACLLLGFVLVAGLVYIKPSPTSLYTFDNQTPDWFVGLFFALKEAASVIAGIVGFSGLAWSNFYKAAADAEVARLKAGSVERP